MLVWERKKNIGGSFGVLVWERTRDVGGSLDVLVPGEDTGCQLQF